VASYPQQTPWQSVKLGKRSTRSEEPPSIGGHAKEVGKNKSSPRGRESPAHHEVISNRTDGLTMQWPWRTQGHQVFAGAAPTSPQHGPAYHPLALVAVEDLLTYPPLHYPPHLSPYCTSMGMSRHPPRTVTHEKAHSNPYTRVGESQSAVPEPVMQADRVALGQRAS
jgi:hypothetical protein